MKEDNKYYTPEISELFIGYECEEWSKVYLEHEELKKDVLVEGFDETLQKSFIHMWFPRTITGGMRDLDLPSVIRDKKLRTPYLSKEDIEKEGFKEVKEIFELVVPEEGFNEWKYLKVYLEGNHKIKITETFESSWANFTNTIFHGECKSVNELRKIKKMLCIKK